jgi:arylsulfatase A-like enzyme/phosphodiesterase/alkaline phosphatase D-like protein
VTQHRPAKRQQFRRLDHPRPAALIFGLLFALTSLGAAGSSARAADRSKPNFIYINIDDLGYADIEPFGSKVNRTPNLNRMAEEGRKLTCFYAAPVCSPSRASLMTGSYPKRALSIPHVLFPGNAEGLDQGEVTVAELLKEQGYATGIIGKWHLGDQPEFLPRKHGFDYYYGLPYSNDMGPAADGVKSNLGVPLPNPRNVRRKQPPLPLLRNETVLQRVLPNDQQAIVERYTNEAVSFLWDHRDEPFFLYLPHSAVHWPLYPGKKFHGKSKHGLFGDWVEEVDWSVGQVLDTVRQLGLAENTMVIFTSDNGGQNRHGAINLPLRGGKGSTFEGGMRVPTIAWWPKKIPAGTASDEIVSTMDILPTLTNLAGGKVPTDRKLDGHDIWPILAGSNDAKSQYEAFYFYRGFNLQCVRSGDWKLHLANGELYNLKDDISEASNVAKAHPEVVAKLRALADAQKDDLGVKDIGPGCRPLGKVENAQPLINHDGKVRDGFEPPSIHAAQGIMLGELTSTSVVAQVRLTKTDQLVANADVKKPGDVAGSEGVVMFVLSVSDKANNTPTASDGLVVGLPRASSENDFIARIQVKDLKPGTEYGLFTTIGPNPENMTMGPRATFRTLPGKDSDAATRFVVVTGMNYGKFHGDNRIDPKIHLQNNNTKLPQPYSGPDKHLGYPALATMLKLKPHFFVGTGDNIYYDTPKEPRAETVPQMRQKWHEQFVQPRYRQFFAKVPTYWMIDDHDYRIDDGDNSGDYLPSSATGLRIMLEQLPYGPADEGTKTKTYRTHRVNKDLQVWFTENRRYRSDNAMEDGPNKSIWGVEQKAWLKKTLAESDATFKLMISPTPMVGPDDKRKFDNHTNFAGFRNERDEFFAWLNETGIAKKNFYLVCGDRHWQYHARHPSGIEEFSCGALVDPNSRLGRAPGDPASTDPDGLIKQFYTQKERSGGFLMIESTGAAKSAPSTLSFVFHDEHGVVLHKHTKQGQ